MLGIAYEAQAVAGKLFVRGKFVRKRRESVKFIIDVDSMKL